jgi:hypothetical protein
LRAQVRVSAFGGNLSCRRIRFARRVVAWPHGELPDRHPADPAATPQDRSALVWQNDAPSERRSSSDRTQTKAIRVHLRLVAKSLPIPASLPDQIFLLFLSKYDEIALIKGLTTAKH